MTRAILISLLSLGCGTSPVPFDGGWSRPSEETTTEGQAQVVGGCPRVLLGDVLPAQYEGDTTSLPHIVTSLRLEWTDAPDDSLEFIAPEAGDYVIDLSSTVVALGASAEDYNTNGTDSFPFTRSACPEAGSVREINGMYNHNSPDYPLALTTGQSIVIFVGAPYWATEKVGSYTLTVRKLP